MWLSGGEVISTIPMLYVSRFDTIPECHRLTDR